MRVPRACACFPPVHPLVSRVTALGPDGATSTSKARPALEGQGGRARGSSRGFPWGGSFAVVPGSRESGFPQVLQEGSLQATTRDPVGSEPGKAWKAGRGWAVCTPPCPAQGDAVLQRARGSCPRTGYQKPRGAAPRVTAGSAVPTATNAPSARPSGNRGVGVLRVQWGHCSRLFPGPKGVGARLGLFLPSAQRLGCVRGGGPVSARGVPARSPRLCLSPQGEAESWGRGAGTELPTAAGESLQGAPSLPLLNPHRLGVSPQLGNNVTRPQPLPATPARDVLTHPAQSPCTLTDSTHPAHSPGIPIDPTHPAHSLCTLTDPARSLTDSHTLHTHSLHPPHTP